jgi:hypothetical protein
VIRVGRAVDGNVIIYQQIKDNTGRFKVEKVEFPRNATLAKHIQRKARLFGSLIPLLFVLFKLQ